MTIVGGLLAIVVGLYFRGIPIASSSSPTPIFDSRKRQNDKQQKTNEPSQKILKTIGTSTTVIYSWQQEQDMRHYPQTSNKYLAAFKRGIGDITND